MGEENVRVKYRRHKRDDKTLCSAKEKRRVSASSNADDNDWTLPPTHEPKAATNDAQSDW